MENFTSPTAHLRALRKKLAFETPLGVYGILSVIFTLFLLEETFGSSQSTLTLVRMGANSENLVLVQKQYYRLFSSIYLHAGFMHLFFNSYVLWALGGIFNKILGLRNFLAIFFVSGLLGSLASVFLGKTGVSVGASGGIWGFLGASLAFALFPSEYFPPIIRKRLLRISIINLLINLGVSMLPMVDFWAHAGGGLGGFVISVVIIYGGFFKKSLNFVLNLLVVLLLLINLSSIGLALFNNKPWEKIHQKDFVEVSLPGFPISFSLPNPLVSEQKQIAPKEVTYGDLNTIGYVVSLSWMKVSTSSALLKGELKDLMSSKSVLPAVKKTTYLRTESYGQVLSLEKKNPKSPVTFLISLLHKNDLLINLTVGYLNDNEKNARELAHKILASIAKK